ncbi:MAG TPA: acetamidase/formamidase family protein [Acidimicrobiia bacterium]|nr:acetamidase/formamidase family protein [Acidimicrobiia bacterium]
MGVMILQPDDGPIDGQHYLRSTPETVRWGSLPARGAQAVLRVASGTVVTIDTVSHEGLLEEFDRDPVAWFGSQGVAPGDVLRDAIDIASSVHHDAGTGPHVVTGPIAVVGAEPGDLLKVEVLATRLRVPYGVISNRHGLGALAGEFPETAGPVWVFTRVDDAHGLIPFGHEQVARFPLAPFLGIMGVATDTGEETSSTPPGPHGGNLDIAALQTGSALYLPVQVAGAHFYIGDPHFAQGNGEVCLTALEGSLRADVRLTLLKDAEARRAVGLVRYPFAETDEHWIAIGLDVDLDEALRDAVRRAISFLSTAIGMERHLAYAYLSAAVDFEVSQVVDGVKGVHCLIRKRDFG